MQMYATVEHSSSFGAAQPKGSLKQAPFWLSFAFIRVHSRLIAMPVRAQPSAWAPPAAACYPVLSAHRSALAEGSSAAHQSETAPYLPLGRQSRPAPEFRGSSGPRRSCPSAPAFRAIIALLAGTGDL